MEREVGPVRVLVVEDKPDAAEALRFALAVRGHLVEIAYDGRSALELARRHLPDVVLCDIGLPDMDGYEVARTLRSHDSTRSMRLIALSGHVRPADIERARRAGFDCHVSKPPDLVELLGLLAEAR